MLSWTEQAPTSKQRRYLRSLKQRLGDRAAEWDDPKTGYDAAAQIAHAEALLAKDAWSRR